MESGKYPSRIFVTAGHRMTRSVCRPDVAAGYRAGKSTTATLLSLLLYYNIMKADGAGREELAVAQFEFFRRSFINLRCHPQDELEDDTREEDAL
jgi:hypothetical protein